jgi:fibro-slime domain-containing protein
MGPADSSVVRSLVLDSSTPRGVGIAEDFSARRARLHLSAKRRNPDMSRHVMWNAIVGHGMAAARIWASRCAAVALGALGCSAGGGGAANVSDDSGLVPPFLGNQPPAALPSPSSSPGAADQLFEDDLQAPAVNAGCGPNLTGILRDFQASHPDFGDAVADDRGLVEHWLGTDLKPVYAPAGPTVTTSGAASFNQWYRDTPGVNQSREFVLPFVDQGNGISTYDNPAFFPLDGEMFGNEHQDHNYHFTFELHTEFAYRGGEVFTFAGDDDLFVFINGQLAIDLGGVHGTQTDSVDLDAEAAALGLTVGASYPLDLFQAERHATGSTFRVDTSLRFTSCGTIVLR